MDAAFARSHVKGPPLRGDDYRDYECRRPRRHGADAQVGECEPVSTVELEK